jgi:imidazolonepropionase-like amidohydrolase
MLARVPFENWRMTQYLFKNFEMLDPEHDELRGGYELLVEGDMIKEVTANPIKAESAAVVDCGRRTLMPGLIDSHVHVVLSEVSIPRLENVPLTLMTARAAVLMRGMLDRGFTSVRDTGGADWGLKEATDKWLLPGPRLFIAGKALGPTGGHSDGRRRTDHGTRCHCCDALHFAMGLADGVAEVRKAVREEMRQGADQVKIMMSGGVASPYDPLDSLQFSLEEVAAAVEEAHAFGRYVCAHAYTVEAITRAAHAGVRTIEHGNLIDEVSAKLMASKGMFLVANLVTYYEMKKRAAEYGMSSDMLAKNDLVIEGGLQPAREFLRTRARHGVLLLACTTGVHLSPPPPCRFAHSLQALCCAWAGRHPPVHLATSSAPIASGTARLAGRACMGHRSEATGT